MSTQFPTLNQWNPSLKTFMIMRRLRTESLSEAERLQHYASLATLRRFGLISGGAFGEDERIIVTPNGEAWIAYVEALLHSNT